MLVGYFIICNYLPQAYHALFTAYRLLFIMRRFAWGACRDAGNDVIHCCLQNHKNHKRMVHNHTTHSHSLTNYVVLQRQFFLRTTHMHSALGHAYIYAVVRYTFTCISSLASPAIWGTDARTPVDFKQFIVAAFSVCFVGHAGN